MPEHIRALIVILFLSTMFFALAKKPASEIIRSVDFARRRNLWLTITLTAFLSPNIWIYLLIAGSLIFFSRPHESNPVTLFFLLLFVVPSISVEIPGMGLVNFLFHFSHQRLLILAILLPAYLALIGQKQTLKFGRIIPDKFIMGYMLLIGILYFREESVTNALRQCFYLITDIFLPYFVISRTLKNLNDFRNALFSFVLAVMVMAPIAVFENLNHWLLYQALEDAWGLDGLSASPFMSYLERANMLRAIASSGQPIVLGYVMAVALGFYLFLQQFIRSRLNQLLGFLGLLAGLLATLSRGPWVGALLIIVLFIATGRNAIRRLSLLILTGVITIAVIGFLPGGEKAVNLLPFIGETGKETITYRERLLDNSIITFKRHPLFGSENYLEYPEMLEMMQGQGIIDIVNTYIGVALSSGLVGLLLFVGFFVTICGNLYKSIRQVPDKNCPEYLLGRALLATIFGIMFTIFTVSSISYIPIVYWSVAGIAVAYINMIKRLQQENKVQSFAS